MIALIGISQRRVQLHPPLLLFIKRLNRAVLKTRHTCFDKLNGEICK